MDDDNGVGGGGSGFSSLPSSIHHGLSERLLQGLTEKLQSLGPTSDRVNLFKATIKNNRNSRLEQFSNLVGLAVSIETSAYT